MSRPPATRPPGRASSSDLRLLRRLALRLHEKETIASLQAITARCPDDLWARQLEARALRAQGRCEEAIALLARLERGLVPAALRLFQAEAALDAGRLQEARRLLEQGREREKDNLSIEGLLHLLTLEEAGLGSTPKLLDTFPAGAIWCPAVLSRLLFDTEAELERRLAKSADGDPIGSEILKTRSSLFRPQLDEIIPATYWLDRLTGWFARALGGRRLDRLRRREALLAALRAGDLLQAGDLSLAAIENPPDKKAVAWPDRIATLEILFLAERWEAAASFHARNFTKKKDVTDEYPAALAASASLVLGKTQAARRTLKPPLAAPPGKTRLRYLLHHIKGLIELRDGHGPGAAALFRVAVEENDLTVMYLISAELDCLERLARPATPSNHEHEQATHEPSP